MFIVHIHTEIPAIYVIIVIIIIIIKIISPFDTCIAVPFQLLSFLRNKKLMQIRYLIKISFILLKKYLLDPQLLMIDVKPAASDLSQALIPRRWKKHLPIIIRIMIVIIVMIMMIVVMRHRSMN